jgi:hypothetical protein
MIDRAFLARALSAVAVSFRAVALAGDAAEGTSEVARAVAGMREAVEATARVARRLEDCEEERRPADAARLLERFQADLPALRREAELSGRATRALLDRRLEDIARALDGRWRARARIDTVLRRLSAPGPESVPGNRRQDRTAARARIARRVAQSLARRMTASVRARLEQDTAQLELMRDSCRGLLSEFDELDVRIAQFVDRFERSLPRALEALRRPGDLEDLASRLRGELHLGGRSVSEITAAMDRTQGALLRVLEMQVSSIESIQHHPGRATTSPFKRNPTTRSHRSEP